MFLAGYCDLYECNKFQEWFYSEKFIWNIPKYSILIVIGIILAFLLAKHECKKFDFDINVVIDGLLIVVPISIIGGRTWYLLFDGENLFANGFINGIKHFIGFNIATGEYEGLRGMAIHGAFLFAMVSGFIYCKKKKCDLYKVLDMMAPGFMIGQILGRWGNFFNREAFGKVIGGFNADLTPKIASAAEQYDILVNKIHVPAFIAKNMQMDNAIFDMGDTYEIIAGSFYYHPTFLYESLWNLLGLILMLILRRTKLVRSGELMALYLVWYGIGRFFIEMLRMDSLYTSFFNLKTAQVISLILIASGIALFIFLRFIKKTPKYYDLIHAEHTENK